MKKALIVIGIVIAVAFVAVAIFLFLIQSRTSAGKGEPASLAMPITGAAINIFDGIVDLKNVTLVNPSGFEERTFISLPEIFVDVDTSTLTGQGVKHFREVRIKIAHVMAIRSKNRKYNFEWILHQKKAQVKAEKTAKQQKMKVRIDRLQFVFGHIIFMDYTVRGGKPLFIRLDVNVDRRYTGIDNLDKLGRAISKSILDKITIGEIRNFEVKDLPDISRSALAAIPDETKDKIFGPGKDRDRVLKELGSRFMNRIKDVGKSG